jgi:hypothetical protein
MRDHAALVALSQFGTAKTGSFTGNYERPNLCLTSLRMRNVEKWLAITHPERQLFRVDITTMNCKIRSRCFIKVVGALVEWKERVIAT